MALRLQTFAKLFRINGIRSMSSVGDLGSGAGKGGGTGGSIREAGGSFGKMEAAHEEQYIRKLQQEQLAELKKHMQEEMKYHDQQIEQHKQAEQLKKLKDHLDEEVEHHEKSIKQHQDAIERHKKRIHDLEKSEKGSDSD